MNGGTWHIRPAKTQIRSDQSFTGRCIKSSARQKNILRVLRRHADWSELSRCADVIRHAFLMKRLKCIQQLRRHVQEWGLTYMRTAKLWARLRVRAVSPEASWFAHAIFRLRKGTRQDAQRTTEYALLADKIEIYVKQPFLVRQRSFHWVWGAV